MTKCYKMSVVFLPFMVVMATKWQKKQLPLFHLTCSQCCFFPNSWIDPQHFTQVLVAFWNLVDLDVVHWWPLGPWTLHWDGDFWWQLFDLWVLKAKILAKKYHQISIPFRQVGRTQLSARRHLLLLLARLPSFQEAAGVYPAPRNWAVRRTGK